MIMQIFRKDSIKERASIKNEAFRAYNDGKTLEDNPYKQKPQSEECLLWNYEFCRLVEEFGQEAA